MRLHLLRITLLVSVVMIPAAAGNIVTNGGFESGLTGWTSSEDWGSGNFAVHSGSLEAYTQCVGAACISTPTSFLYQDLATTPSQTYDLTFWYRFQGMSMPVNELLTLAGGVVVSDLVNQSNNGGVYQSVTTTFVAAGTTTRLQFDGRNDPSFLILDDVCVVAAGETCPSTSTTPEPAPASLAAVGVAAAVLARKFRRASR